MILTLLSLQLNRVKKPSHFRKWFDQRVRGTIVNSVRDFHIFVLFIILLILVALIFWFDFKLLLHAFDSFVTLIIALFLLLVIISINVTQLKLRHAFVVLFYLHFFDEIFSLHLVLSLLVVEDTLGSERGITMDNDWNN